MSEQDVPSPIDVCEPRDARDWERTAQERPGRAAIFQAIGRELLELGTTDLTVLDLGSGRFLAAYVLDTLPAIRLTLLDFSAPMHELAGTRLGPRATRVTFVERSFKDPSWQLDLCSGSGRTGPNFSGSGRVEAVIDSTASTWRSA